MKKHLSSILPIPPIDKGPAYAKALVDRQLNIRGTHDEN